MALSAKKVLGAAGFMARLPWFLRSPIDNKNAHESLRRRFVQRREDFEDFIATAVYGDPGNPYFKLLQLAGCEQGDFSRLIGSEGIEGSLGILAGKGVYLSIDEFKGRNPVVRGSSTLDFDPRTLTKPASPFHVNLRSGGSRGSGWDVPVDLAYIRDRAVSTCVTFNARSGQNWVHGVWGMWGRGAMAVLLELSAFGAYPAFWFSQVDPDAPSLSPLYRWSAHAMRLGSFLAGITPPQIQHVPMEKAHVIAQWMAEVCKSGRTPHLHTHASSAVLVCEQANAAGLDIRGAQFTAASEPMTSARMNAIQRAGAKAWPQYASVETGVIGLACLDPATVDDVHLLHDRFAVIQSQNVDNLPAESLLLSSLRQSSAPFNFLNVSLGDQASLEQRSCGCPMEQLGWHTHMHTIRSQEKLTALGMNFLDTDVIHVLEEVLPARFGGGPMDYQLLEEIDTEGQSRLRLLVEPTIGPIDLHALRDSFLTAIGASSDSDHIMSQLWRDSGILSVERLTPRKTSAGKILHVHQQRLSR